MFLFVVLWGLDRDGKFHTKHESTWTSWLSTYIFGSMHMRSDVKHNVLEELRLVVEKALQERQQLERKYVSARHKARRLLYLFQCDLLPGISGQILSSKGSRDGSSGVAPVSLLAKVTGYLFIFGLDAGMLFYIFLFAMNQTKYRQQAWLQSFLLWVMTEILFVSTFVVFMVHYALPTMIMKDIAKITERLKKIVVEYSAQLPTADAQSLPREVDAESRFNSAKYFFVSWKLAASLPDLHVAQLIRRFSTPWPRQSYQHVHNHAQSYRVGAFYGIGNICGMALLFALSTFVNFSPACQDGLAHMLFTVVVGSVVMAHTLLYGIFPALAFLPLFVFCVLVHFGWQVSKNSTATIRNAVVTPLDPSDEKQRKSQYVTRSAGPQASVKEGTRLLQRNRSQIDSNDQNESEIDSIDCYISVSSLDSIDEDIGANDLCTGRSNCNIHASGLDDIDFDADDESMYIISSNSEQEHEQQATISEERDAHFYLEVDNNSMNDGDENDSCFDSAEHDDWD